MAADKPCDESKLVPCDGRAYCRTPEYRDGLGPRVRTDFGPRLVRIRKKLAGTPLRLVGLSVHLG